MQCWLFVKHLFFCVMVLSIGMHATSSIAKSLDRLPKITSILSVFAKGRSDEFGVWFTGASTFSFFSKTSTFFK